MVAATIYRAADKPRGRVLCLSGWMGSQKGNVGTAMDLSNMGFDVLTFDLRGHGDSEGKLLEASRSDYLEDCEVAYDLLARESTATKCYLYGISYGGYLAGLLLGTRPVEGFVLRVPANFTRDGIDHPLLALEECDWSKPVTHTQVNDNLREFEGSGLIVVSGKDEIIHPHVNIGFRRSVEGLEKVEFFCMEDSGHNLGIEDHHFFEGMMLDWFERVPEDRLALFR